MFRAAKGEFQNGMRRVWGRHKAALRLAKARLRFGIRWV